MKLLPLVIAAWVNFLPLVLGSAVAAPTVELSADGTIVIGGSTRVFLEDSGVVRITRGNGDNYTAWANLFRKADNKWFSTMHMENRKVTVDPVKKTTTFRGTFTVPGRSQAIPAEVSAAIRPDGKVRITLQFGGTTPIQQFMTAGLECKSPRDQHAGQTVQVATLKNLLSKETPEPKGTKTLYAGPLLHPVIFFPGIPERQLTFIPVQAIGLEVADDYRTSPNVHIRLQPRGNVLICDLQFTNPDRVASAETYQGVDYLAESGFRLPRYAASRNLVQNPGFEAGFHGWRRHSLGDLTSALVADHYEIQQGDAFAGKRALKLRGEKGQSPSHLASFAIPVEAGATYTMSFYGRADRKGLVVSYSSVTAVWPVFVGKVFSLTTEWQRYDYSFKAPNEMVTVDFGIPGTQADGVAWIDNVQLEKGPLTEFAEKPVGASVVTNARGNWNVPGAKTGARLELYGAVRASGSAALKMTDFYGGIVREETLPFTLGADGTVQLPLPWAEGLELGIYIIETNLKLAQFSDRDFSRLMILPFADGPALHKNLFGFGGDSPRSGSWARRLEFFQHAGIGSAVYFDPPTTSYLKLMQQRGILDLTSIFKGGMQAVQKNLITDYRRTDDEIKLLEAEAYEKTKASPEISHWKTVNEPGEKMMANLTEMKEFVRPLVAAYRGIKRANPKAIVLSPDPANMDPKHGIRFLDVFLQAGGKAACDVIAIHPYRARPEDPDLDADTATLLQVLTKHGYTGDVWFSEGMGNFHMSLPAWGVDVHKSLSQEEGKSGGWRVGNLTYDLGIGERAAAAYAMRYWLVGLKYGDRIKQQVNWYYPNNSILDYDLTPGAEIFASSTLKRLLGDSTFKQDLKLGDGLRGYLFEDGKRRPVAVLWSYDIRVDKGTAKGPLFDGTTLPGNVELLDFTSRSMARAKAMRLTSFPLFIRGAPGSTAVLAKSLSELQIQPR